MKVDTDLIMPHRAGDYTEWILSYPGASHEEQLSIKVYKQWWQELSRGEVPQSGARNLLVEWEEDKMDWFRVSIREVTVSRRGDLYFEMKDVVCPYWKSGIYFDFLDLSRIF